MVVGISAGQAGSAGGLVHYLEKEQPGQWYTHDRENIGPLEVAERLDTNRKNIGKEEPAFYQITLNPSQKELAHIGNDPAKLKAFTRDAMEKYAAQFNREGLTSGNLVWYAKIEQQRRYKGYDPEVKNAQAKSGQLKPGLQTHIHVLVSRCEDLQQFKRIQQETGRKTPYKLSPATNHRGTEKGPVRGGFERKAFITAVEQAYDRRFAYARSHAERFDRSKPLEIVRPAPERAQAVAPPKRAPQQELGR